MLRSSLSLSLLMQEELRIINIRAGRSKPGLRAQHLKAVEAAGSVGRAQVSGADPGSTTLTFQPSGIRPGRYQFDIGTAGATTLVLQTIFLPLAMAGTKSSVTITGGTHVKWSPCYHYLEWQWLPFMRRMGCQADLNMELAGYYPQGGGRIHATIYPCQRIEPLELTDRGGLKQVRGLSAISNLPRHIAKRQREQVLRRIGSRFYLSDIRLAELPSRFKGTLLLLLAEFEHSQACYFSLGELGKPAERVADESVDALEEFLSTEGAIDQYLADQVLLPLAFAHGPSRFHTSKITRHLITNAAVLRSFLSVQIDIKGNLGEPGLVTIKP